MAEGVVRTALGQRIETRGKGFKDSGIRFGRPPVVLQTQAYAYIPLERPEELKQWEDDLQKFYGISVKGADLRSRACETCSCGCTDDCGFVE